MMENLLDKGRIGNTSSHWSRNQEETMLSRGYKELPGLVVKKVPWFHAGSDH